MPITSSSSLYSHKSRWSIACVALALLLGAGPWTATLSRASVESDLVRSEVAKSELDEAARMDGCGEFGIYWRIVLPLLKPALGTLGLITFIGSWNNFIGPLIVIRDMEMYTVPLALRSLQGTGQIPWGAISAGSAIAVLPLLVLFMLASRRLIEGLTAGAVKA